MTNHPNPLYAPTGFTKEQTSIVDARTLFYSAYDGQWVSFTSKQKPVPEAGWKIHMSLCLSALATHGPTIIQHLLDYHPSCIKIAGTLAFAQRLNSGLPDKSQIGKIITIYPGHIEELRLLTQECVRLVSNSTGPAILSDLWAEPCGRVGLRFGSFVKGRMLDYVGRTVPAIRTPTGALVGDVRSLTGKQHDFAPPISGIKIFERAHFSLSEHFQYVHYPWHLLALLHSSAKGEVGLALRKEPPFELSIVKSANKGVSCTSDDRDSIALLRQERGVLSELTEKGFPCPHIIDYHEGSHQDILFTSDIGGYPLAYLPPHAQLDRVADILRTVQRLHDLGFVHRDLKAENMILSGDQVYLIDFELACHEGYNGAARALTPGYTHPQDRSLSHKARDYYSLAFLFAQNLLETPTSSLPSDPCALMKMLPSRDKNIFSKIITSLLEGYRKKEVIILPRLVPSISKIFTHQKTDPDNIAERRPEPRDWKERVIVDAANILRQEAKEDEHGIFWKNHRPGEELISSNLANGTAGTTLALVVFDHVAGTNHHEAMICGAGRWLCHRPVDSCSGGLFTGYAGIALVLSTLAKRYQCSEFYKGSMRFFKAMEKGSKCDPDFYFGGAGMLYAASASALSSGDSSALSFVSSIAKYLRRTAKKESGIICWNSSGIIADRVNPCLGLAHGNVGTALALATYAKAAKESSFLHLAEEVLLSTFEHGRDMFDYQIRIALNEDQAPDPPHYWCRGLGGLLWVSLQVFQVEDPRFFRMRCWLADRIFSSHPGGNISYCHGLSGRLEILRMLRAIPCYKLQAEESIHALESRLYRSAVEKDGRLTWHTEDIGEFSNELWLGGLSGATALALLSSGHSTPLISPQFLSCASNWLGASLVESA